MSVTIPGALADHLTAERPFDLDTRAALDDARRGRGRTLVLEPRSMTALHVISRRAEQLLADSYATDAQKRAARKWIAAAGHAPQIITVRFASTEEAYDASQCAAEIRNGDVLVVEDEQAVAFMHDAWPVAVTTAHGEFHGDGTAPTVEAARGASARAAADAAYAIGAPLASAELQQDAEQAVAEAAADDAPEATPTVEEVEASYAAQLVTEADATAGTWRGAWIGEHSVAALPALFDLDTEQGALFDDRAAVEEAPPAAVEAAPEPFVAPEVTRASVDAYLAREYPALYAPEQPRPLELEPAFMWAVTHRVVIRGEWVGLIMCGLGRREADDRAGALLYTGSKAVEVVLCEHGPNAHRDARLAARCEGCGYAIPRGEQWHDACRPRPRLTPLERARRAAARDAGYARALDASDAVTAAGGEPPF
ncbi:hypothetical protein ACFCXS_15350 [Streptomyces sp. NPDC056373]|uniref:hypothetical protein n=1 Tax=Streptomyces sp. NPDC056373 TaxID=3345798 RepID=UPI0035DFC747